MIRLVSITRVPRLALIALLSCVVPSTVQACTPSVHQQRISPEHVAICKDHFHMSQVIALITNSPDRPSSRRYLQTQKHLHFVATQKQGEMLVDGYSIGDDPKAPIIGYSLFYYRAEGPLAIAYVTVNPLNAGAAQRIESLIGQALDSITGHDGAMLHFLGIYDLDSKRILKIMIRKAKTSMGPDYSVGYTVSAR